MPLQERKGLQGLPREARVVDPAQCQRASETCLQSLRCSGCSIRPRNNRTKPMKTVTPCLPIPPGFMALMILCYIYSAISPRLEAAEPRAALGAAASVRGNLLLEAKGEVE